MHQFQSKRASRVSEERKKRPSVSTCPLSSFLDHWIWVPAVWTFYGRSPRHRRDIYLKLRWIHFLWYIAIEEGKKIIQMCRYFCRPFLWFLINRSLLGLSSWIQRRRKGDKALCGRWWSSSCLPFEDLSMSVVLFRARKAFRDEQSELSTCMAFSNACFMQPDVYWKEMNESILTHRLTIEKIEAVSQVVWWFEIYLIVLFHLFSNRSIRLSLFLLLAAERQTGIDICIRSSLFRTSEAQPEKKTTGISVDEERFFFFHYLSVV